MRTRFVSMLAATCLGFAAVAGSTVSAQAAPSAAQTKVLFGGRERSEFPKDLGNNIYLDEWTGRLAFVNAAGLCDPKNLDHTTLSKLDDIIQRSPLTGRAPEYEARRAVTGGAGYTNEFRHDLCTNEEVKKKYIGAFKAYQEAYGEKLVFDDGDDLARLYYAKAIDIYQTLKDAGIDMDQYFTENIGQKYTQDLPDCYTATWKPPPSHPGTEDEETKKYEQACKPREDDD